MDSMAMMIRIRSIKELADLSRDVADFPETLDAVNLLIAHERGELRRIVEAAKAPHGDE